MVLKRNARCGLAARPGFSALLGLQRAPASGRAAAFAVACLALAGAANAAPVSGALIEIGDTAHAGAEPQDELVGAGWLKTFPYAEDGAPLNIAGAAIFVPEVHETVLEADARAALLAELEKRGYRLSAREEEANYTLTYSAEIQNEFRKTPPQSPIRFAPPLSDPQRDDRFGRDVPASMTFDPHTVYYDKGVNRLGNRSVSMTVYLNKGEERVWAGFAAARMGPAGRSALAKTMAEEIVASLGETKDEPAAIFRAAAHGASAFEPPVGETN